jgi:hypothetical protein
MLTYSCLAQSPTNIPANTPNVGTNTATNANNFLPTPPSVGVPVGATIPTNLQNHFYQIIYDAENFPLLTYSFVAQIAAARNNLNLASQLSNKLTTDTKLRHPVYMKCHKKDENGNGYFDYTLWDSYVARLSELHKTLRDAFRVPLFQMSKVTVDQANKANHMVSSVPGVQDHLDPTMVTASRNLMTHLEQVKKGCGDLDTFIKEWKEPDIKGTEYELKSNGYNGPEAWSYYIDFNGNQGDVDAEAGDDVAGDAEMTIDLTGI